MYDPPGHIPGYHAPGTNVPIGYIMSQAAPYRPPPPPSKAQLQAQAAQAAKLAAAKAKADALAKIKKATHDAAVAANARKYPQPQTHYRSEINSLDAKIKEVDRITQRGLPIWGTFLFIAGIVYGILTASLHLTDMAIFSAVYVLVFLWFPIKLIRLLIMKSSRPDLIARRARLIPAIGCGKECGYGCRNGIVTR